MEQAQAEKKSRLLAEIKKTVAGGRRFALFSHVEPDGDAIGSQVALTLALEQLGKEVTSLRLDEVPPALGFLNREGAIEKYRPERDRARISAAEVTVLLDCCNYYRLGSLASLVEETRSLKINIDHHRDNAFFGDINFVRFIAGGTAELVFEVIGALGIPIRGTIAEALYVGLSTDTVGFRYIDPEGNMIAVISELIRGGIDVEDLQEKIYCHRPDSYLDDLAGLLGGVNYENGGALAWFTLPTSRHLTFYQRELASEALKQLLSIQKIRAALMLHQEESGVEVWLRSKTEVDVGRAAERLGGGGHRTAAGVLLRGEDLAASVPKVLYQVRTEL